MISEQKCSLWTDIETTCLGQSSAPWIATGVSIDSRSIVPGDLFVALRGPCFDGHDFVDQAVAAGAAAVMVANDNKDSVNVSIPTICLDDTLDGLEGLARLARARSNAQIVGITGSVGKTGTKEALRLALAESGTVYATEGNLNNHLGLPLSLARLPKNTDFGIFEMGMSARGEISHLSSITRPHIALITLVSEVHSEFFNNLNEIAEAKAEIFSGLEKSGIAILNRDHDQFEKLSYHASQYGVTRVMSFGEHIQAKVRLLNCNLGESSSTIEADICGHTLSYRIAAAGKHQVINSLGVLAAVHTIGANLELAAASLHDFKAMRGRGERREIFWKGCTFEIIDESYNSSPASMMAAIEVLASARPRGSGKRIAVIGDMLELGARSKELHASLAEPITASEIDLVFTAGSEAVALWERLPLNLRGGHALNASELKHLVLEAIGDGDIALVKGSQGSRMNEVVNALETAGYAIDNSKCGKQA